jgi:hypothetical protein
MVPPPRLDACGVLANVPGTAESTSAMVAAARILRMGISLQGSQLNVI